MRIPYVNLVAQWEQEKEQLLPLIDKVLSSGNYIGGKPVEDFESKAAAFTGSKHCIALNSGTDALMLGLLALGVKPGDEVITPPNSFVASSGAIANIGAKPVFVDVLPDQNIDPSKIAAAITSKTKAIMPVHLTGRMARMDEIVAIADAHGIPVIEDAAQSIGSRYKNRPSGKWGKIGCFSAHPLKNLNACGDAGFLLTDDDVLAAEIRLRRNHGLVDRNTVQCFGYVSRMDAIQAAVLSFRLDKLNEVSEKRRHNAALYMSLLDRSKVFVPAETADEYNTYHTFVIQVSNRDQLKKQLEEQGIETSIHYPIPIHLQPAADYLGFAKGSFPATEDQAGRILTLPVNQFLTDNEIVEIANQVNKFAEA